MFQYWYCLFTIFPNPSLKNFWFRIICSQPAVSQHFCRFPAPHHIRFRKLQHHCCADRMSTCFRHAHHLIFFSCPPANRRQNERIIPKFWFFKIRQHPIIKQIRRHQFAFRRHVLLSRGFYCSYDNPRRQKFPPYSLRQTHTDCILTTHWHAKNIYTTRP